MLDCDFPFCFFLISYSDTWELCSLRLSRAPDKCYWWGSAMLIHSKSSSRVSIHSIAMRANLGGWGRKQGDGEACLEIVLIQRRQCFQLRHLHFMLQINTNYKLFSRCFLILLRALQLYFCTVHQLCQWIVRQFSKYSLGTRQMPGMQWLVRGKLPVRGVDCPDEADIKQMITKPNM